MLQPAAPPPAVAQSPGSDPAAADRSIVARMAGPRSLGQLGRRPAGNLEAGVVLTAAEKAAADEAARKQKELEEAEARLLAEKEAEEEEKGKKTRRKKKKLM